MEEIVPLITCEIALCQYVSMSASCFFVNVMEVIVVATRQYRTRRAKLVTLKSKKETAHTKA